MTIKQYIERDSIRYINGIPFVLYDVNHYENLDINEKTEYDDGIKYSFAKRLKMAINEIKVLTEGMNKAEAMDYFKRETEDGNIHYWGDMFFVSTNNNYDDEIYFGVRMD